MLRDCEFELTYSTGLQHEPKEFLIFFGKAAAAEVPAEIQALLDKRAAARKAKDWAESDRLRDEIAAAGWSVKDSRDGQTVTRK